MKPIVLHTECSEVQKDCDCACGQELVGSGEDLSYFALKTPIIHLYHWWPGRKFRGPTPFPVFFVDEAIRMKSPYLTVALMDLGDGCIVHGKAYCCKKDFPSRKVGRAWAITRLEAEVDKLFEGTE